uniref:SCP domain-containing protein n=1 Tax=Chromera velia CCMP2878 TaxID=1169474 RepID=A0A0G4HTX9_9ALVE|eukprot:Cvel_31656.t1-p1 / transcript=Cvel_31656.t1 / gene=Cvel_31656 / organism=Chromera_velia_CCMP2878 / gene_product=hypothetical protein / transcript_product=hypothetical protein / location=Cvel_scaffold4758:6308-6652(-) / protein_length=115 / sequence_SO=supercontig / SO=protein_coding / is_pseudo=false
MKSWILHLSVVCLLLLGVSGKLFRQTESGKDCAETVMPWVKQKLNYSDYNNLKIAECYCQQWNNGSPRPGVELESKWKPHFDKFKSKFDFYHNSMNYHPVPSQREAEKYHHYAPC